MTPTTKQYDALILGSGQAGNPLASAFAAKGKHVAVIERAFVGGTCINYGCTPTKTMVASAEVAYLARHAAEFGVRTGAVSVELPIIRNRKRNLVQSWREGSEKRLKDVDLIHGEASFLSPKEIQVRLNQGGSRTLTAPIIVIDTGLSPGRPDLPGLDTVPALDNVSIMELDRLPEHLLVLGGGYIGLEFAQMFRRFGSRVTILQDGPQLLPAEDEDVGQEVAKILREDGINLLLSAEAHSVCPADNHGISITVTTGATTLDLEGSHLLVATGRKPDTATLNLAAAGIATNPHGFIQVDEYLQTSVPGIYATGDINGGPAFTHVSYDDYRILKANLLESSEDKPMHSTKDRILPYCVFLDPQLGRVGLSEKQAAAEGIKVRVAKLPMSSVARALETGQTRGFLKALVDPETHQILGAACLAQDGGEIMAMLQIAMLGKLPATTLQNAMLAHPTLAEALNTLFAKLEDA